MVATRHTQSLTDFRQKATETLERLNRTGEAEVLTVNGEARAVLLSPAVYDEMAREAQLTRDVPVIRQAMKQIDEGKGMEVDAVFGSIRAELLAMKNEGQRKADGR
ncbi:type II toxin-antitoxin system Phd/YefM family antitoxin [Humisphaera borealis]|uniref:Antitoxin n=1 Tax=Humisphaera borealis TaxID=2807512 RepID=A0A7M2X2E2_9BACT|nr:type II toxin-antitoxin system Phd/YefM family antitoxin [Humisphaera borealis]QOV91918.1 type II toxin-antitoxin system Phd/YefM family antitoxin [Humisphaera borealis]